jgi:hypothetical protein
MFPPISMMKGLLPALALFLTVPLAGAPLAPREYPLTVSGVDLVLPYQGSHPLEGEQSHVRRVVIAIHGGGYNAQEGYNAVIVASGGHAGAADAVAIVAPQFLRSSEVPGGIPDNLLYWNNFPFRGTSSARYGPDATRVTISVFDVLDRMLETITDAALFPNLETVVVAGFSAGGQTVNRYAIAGRFEATLPAERDIHMRYMVLAPSSYLYFTPERDADGDGVFSVPETSCTGYNEWGYGFDDLWSYPAGTGSTTMREQYPKRFVFYLVGENDNNPADPSLATGCTSSLQGSQRVARAEIYFNHLLEVYGEGIRQYQSLHIVPGAGHSFSQNLNSVVGRRYLFDVDPTDTDGDGQTDWGEWIAGTDPANPADRFAVSWNTSESPGLYQMDWPSLPRRKYDIFSTTDSVDGFTPVETIVSGEDADLAQWPVTIGNETRFFRIEAQLQ